MPRGNNDRGRTFRGGRYRGRGANGHGPNRGNGRGRGRGVAFMEDPLDFPVQMWSDNSIYTPNRGGYRGRGRGSGSSSQPNSGPGTPGRGRGGDSHDFQYQSPQRRGAAAGRGSRLRRDAPLSKLLYEERPFLKPIIFVPSVYTRTLFEQEEDLLQPQVEDIADEDKSHVPTADRVTRIFSDDEVEEGEEIQEIDFEDMGRIREEVDAAFTSNTVEAVAESRTAEPKIVEERFTGVLVERTLLQPKDEPRTIPARDDTLAEEMGFYADSKPASDSRFPRNGDASGAQEVAESTGFFIDTTPATTSPANTRHQPIIIDRMADQLLGEDEEIIVYVAPHPRVTKAPIRLEPAPSLPSTSILTGTTSTFASSSDAITAPLEEQSVNDHNKTAPPTIPQAPSFDSISFSFANEVSPKITPKKQQPRTRPVFTAGERNKSKAKARKKEARAARRRLERRAMFGSFGAIMSEAQLRGDDEQVGTGKDPRWEERRRGDSDIDWGDTDEGDDAVRVGRAARVLDGVDEVSNGVGAMELDSEIDMEAMKAFVKGMSANGGRHVTMDDIADEEQMRLEDASGGFQRGSESGASDSDGEIEEEGSVIDEEDDLIKGEEEMMMGVPRNMSPSDDDGDEDDLSDEIDQSPNSGFQARLQRLRKTTWRKQVTDRYLLSEEDTSDDDFFDGYTRAEDDDDFIAHVEDLLDAKGGSVLSSAEREARKRLFQAVQNGEFSDPEQDIGPTKRKKGMNIPIELQDQWARDRSKKAENKRARAKARLEAAADPLLPKKGGKKGHKAILAAAKLDPSSSIPERVVDMVTLEQQIRRFLADISGKATMVLPPMNKESRKQVHELATAFHLKSQSKGKGDGRYTTLMKTTRSGIAIDERKVGRVVKHGRVFMQPGAKGKNAIIMPRHKDGDEVGKAAPKIGEANIGFKMLASMGWSEGDRIGISGGLVAPLTAVIKNTKLGLGANR